MSSSKWLVESCTNMVFLQDEKIKMIRGGGGGKYIVF
jgi:hypothetical protein